MATSPSWAARRAPALASSSEARAISRLASEAASGRGVSPAGVRPLAAGCHSRLVSTGAEAAAESVRPPLGVIPPGVWPPSTTRGPGAFWVSSDSSWHGPHRKELAFSASSAETPAHAAWHQHSHESHATHSTSSPSRTAGIVSGSSTCPQRQHCSASTVLPPVELEGPVMALPVIAKEGPEAMSGYESSSRLVQLSPRNAQRSRTSAAERPGRCVATRGQLAGEVCSRLRPWSREESARSRASPPSAPAHGQPEPSLAAERAGALTGSAQMNWGSAPEAGGGIRRTWRHSSEESGVTPCASQ